MESKMILGKLALPLESSQSSREARRVTRCIQTVISIFQVGARQEEQTAGGTASLKVSLNLRGIKSKGKKEPHTYFSCLYTEESHCP